MRILWCLLVVCPLACGLSEPEPAALDVSGSPPGVAAKPPQPKCPASGCPSIPNLDDYELSEVHEFGVPNAAGVQVDGLWKEHVRYQPDVTGAQLTATFGASVLGGAALIGSYFRLLTPTGVYKLYIVNVSSDVRYWLGPATTVESYELQYTRPGDVALLPLCASPPPLASGDGNVWLEPTHALLFAGDRYDDHWRITASTAAEAGDWFNIGCAGGEITKLLLNRHTTAGSTSTMQTTRAQRQDLLSMYVGDVCGTGHSFTEPNTPLRWGSSNHWRGLQLFSTYEAVWSGGRAICLNTFRTEDTDPFIRAAIDWECKHLGAGTLPSCATLPGFPGAWTSLGNVISANP